MNHVKAFLRDERGSHTIEFVIWIPLFLFFLAATIDASVLYLTHTEMWNVARDTARRMSMGQLSAGSEAQNYAVSQLPADGTRYYVPAPTDDDGEAVVTIRTYVWDASVFGIFGLFQDTTGSDYTALTLDATVTMRMEPDA